MTVASSIPAEMYDSTLEEINQLVQMKKGSPDVFGRVCYCLQHFIPHYTWVGIYALEGNVLRLRAYDGSAATEHTAIELGRGVCGWAAKTGATVIVPDVNEDPRYLACFTSTRSEIVVPIKDGERVLGEIDIDSDKPEAFTLEDQNFLEKVATLLIEQLAN